MFGVCILAQIIRAHYFIAFFLRILANIGDNEKLVKERDKPATI